MLYERLSHPTLADPVLIIAWKGGSTPASAPPEPPRSSATS